MKLIQLFKGSKVLVTGHTGFKGSWLTSWLYKLGADVSGISLGAVSNPSHFDTIELDEFVRSYYIDIRDKNKLQVAIKEIKPDFVFHLAAQSLVMKSYSDPIETWETNLMGTINILEALRGLNNSCIVTLVTSDKCYKNVEWLWGYREIDELGGTDPYSASKAATEVAIHSYVKSYFPKNNKIRIAIGRAGNVIGGGDWAENRIVPDCIRAWASSESVVIRNLYSTRPWQHVLEPLSGYLNLALHLSNDNLLHGEAFNFGPLAQQNYSVLQLIQEMKKHWDKVSWVEDNGVQKSIFESTLLKLNCDKALHFLNWHSVWNFEQTILETTTWYRKYYENPCLIKDKTLEQIDLFSSDAQKIGLSWAK